jgi:DNA-binding IclR family transcriptional regulator
MDENEGPRQIKSVKRIERFIELLRDENGATLTEIATKIDLSIGTVHTYLSTLEDIDFVVKEGDRFKLSPRLVVLGEHVRNQSPLYRAAQPQIDRLAEATGEAVHLIIENNGRGISLYERLGEDAIGTEYHRRLRQKSHNLLHCTASGKAILEQFPKSRVEEIIDTHGLQRQTRNTITEKSALFEDLETITERGYAINDEEEVLGIFAVGVGINDEQGRLHGSVSISAPKAHMDRDEFRREVVDELTRASNAIEANLHSIDLGQMDD